MPRVGSSSSRIRGCRRQPFADHDLLLVAAAKASPRSARCRCSARRAAPPRRGERRLAVAKARMPKRDSAPTRAARHCRRSTVEMQAARLAVLGHQRDAERDMASAGVRDHARARRRCRSRRCAGRGRRRRSPSSISVRPEPSSPPMPRISPRAQLEADAMQHAPPAARGCTVDELRSRDSRAPASPARAVSPWLTASRGRPWPR